MADTTRGGRPPKLTPAVARGICADLAAGVPRPAAARRAGVGYTTLKTWLARGRGETAGVYRDFRAAVKKAEAEFVARNVETVRAAAAGGVVVERATATGRDGRTVVTEKFTRPEWTAAAWLLERRRPRAFGAERLLVRQLRERVAELEAQARVLAAGGGSGGDDVERFLAGVFARRLTGGPDPTGPAQ